MTLVAVVHDPDARRIGDARSPDGNPAAGLTDVGDPPDPDARNRENLGGLPRAAMRILGSCDDFGRLDMSWLYAPDENERTGEHRPTILPLAEVMEVQSLPLGLAVS